MPSLCCRLDCLFCNGKLFGNANLEVWVYVPCRQKASADLEAVRAQYTAATDQLRAQYSAEAESSRNARFEELERLRAEKNAEIELLRSKQASEAEVWRAQHAADAESASAELERQRIYSAEQLEAMTHECEALRAQLEDAMSREDNAVR